MNAAFEKGGQAIGGKDGELGLGTPGHHFTPAWLEMDLLAGVAPEVVFFTIISEWRVEVEQRRVGDPRNQMLDEPHLLLSKMSALTSVHVERPLDSATLRALASLPHNGSR